MLFQNIIRGTGKFRKLTAPQHLSSIKIVKSYVYNDSIKAPEKLQREALKPVDNSFEEQYTLSSMVFGTKNKPPKDWFADFRRVEFTPDGINSWWRFQKKEIEMIQQEFMEERHKILGSDLAAATFIISRGGKAKFKGHDEWTVLDKNGNIPLPNTFDPKYVLVELDCSGINLYHESLHNLINLTRLKWISFRGNEYFNDWCVDKISAEMINLEYLDISECEQVSERGLESLYKLSKLKKLIVTNAYNSQAMELTCLMLEDCIPGLECELKPSNISTDKKNENES